MLEEMRNEVAAARARALATKEEGRIPLGTFKVYIAIFNFIAGLLQGRGCGGEVAYSSPARA